MKKAILFRRLKNKEVQCLACSWYCRIKEGNTGICGVRQNLKGELYLLVYGIASAVNIDPIEKKPLFHFLPGTDIFSIGTVGCNFGCQFCQNWSISQATRNLRARLLEEGKLRDFSLEIGKLGYKLAPEQIIDYCVEHDIKSIAFTYNEPAIFFEYLYDTAKLAKSKGIKVALVSNGYFSREAVEKLNGLIDAINIDLKSSNDKFYQKVAQARLKPVLENIKRFYGDGVWVEVTTLLIPGENDSKKELKQIADFIKSVSPSIPWHVTSFHPDYKMLSKSATPYEKIKEARIIGKEAGLRYVYVGNVFDEEGESTYCPKCKTLLISRSGFSSDLVNFRGGKCLKCSENIEGVWE